MLLFGKPCFKNVICLGHIVDAKGEKMSKSKGNVIDPWRIINNQGADALRWYMFTTSPAGNVKRLSVDQVNEAMRKVLSTVWNTYSFFVIYANIDQFDPVKAERPATTDELDRWIISELNQLIDEVDQAYARLRSHRGRAGRSRSSSTTSPTGTCGGTGGASGRARTTPTSCRPTSPSTTAWSRWPS